MPAERQRHDLRRGWLVLLALACLTVDAAAQKKGGGKRGGGKRADKTEAKPERPAPEVKEFLPGFEAKPGAPAGPKAAKKPPAKPAPPKPLDPMAEADAVTAAADHQARLAAAEAELLQEHFRLCDLDENGWISLREGTAALALDRGDYRRLDANQDGRLDAAEFARERASLLARLGALPEAEPAAAEREPPAGPDPQPAPPDAPPGARAAAKPDSPLGAGFASEIGAMTVKPGAFLRRFDADASGGVSGTELEAALAEGGLGLSAAQALEVLDRNDSGQLEGGELFPFAWLASKARSAAEPATSEPGGAAEPAAVADAAEVEAGVTERREVGPGGGSHFARLDPTHDGFIDEADLRTLQSPARLDLRVRAVLSALDRDGDGRLSELEFRTSMGAGPR